MKEAIKRALIAGIGILLQIIISLFIYIFLINKLWVISLIFSILKIIVIVGLIRSSKNYSYTLTWLIILIIFPLLGTLLYIIIFQNKNISKVLKNITASEKNSKKYLIQDEQIREEIKDNSRLRYIANYAGYPVTKNNDVMYYSKGELAFNDMLKYLEKAKMFSNIKNKIKIRIIININI